MTAGSAEKSQQRHKYFLQYSTFASERHEVQTWGRQTCFLPRAPSNLVTPLTPRSTNKADLGGKTHSGNPGHMRKNAFYRNLKGTFEDLLPCYCCAIKNNSRTVREQSSQSVPAGKGAGMSELQSHHYMTPE